jgi:hypothetical protein
MDEQLMREYAVPPRELPVLDVRRSSGQSTAMSLVPYALWVVGANGRLDLFTPTQRLSVVDLGEPGEGSRWTLVATKPSLRAVLKSV